MPANNDMSPLDRISGAFHEERAWAKIDFAVEMMEAVFPDESGLPIELVEHQLRDLEDGFALRVLVGWLKRKMKAIPQEDWKRLRIFSPLQTLARNNNLSCDLVNMLVDAGVQEVAVSRKLSNDKWARLIRLTSPETEVAIQLAINRVHPGGGETSYFWMPDRIFPIYFRKLWRSVRDRRAKELAQRDLADGALVRVMGQAFVQGDLHKVFSTVHKDHRPVGARMAVELLNTYWMRPEAQWMLSHPDLPVWKVEWAIQQCWGQDSEASRTRIQTLMAMPRTPERYLRIWYAHAENWLHLAQNPALPADLAVTLWEVGDRAVRGRLMRHPAIPAEEWREYILNCLDREGGWGGFLGSPEEARRTLDDPRMDNDTWVEMFTILRRLNLAHVTSAVEDVVAEFFFAAHTGDIQRTAYRTRSPAPLGLYLTRMVGDLLASKEDHNDHMRLYQTLRRVLTAADGFPSGMLVAVYDAIMTLKSYDVKAQMNIITMLGQQENRSELAAIIDLHAEQIVKDAFMHGVEQVDPIAGLRDRDVVFIPAAAPAVERAS